MLINLARDDYCIEHCIGGFALAGPNWYCNPTTALLIIIITPIFILSILIILFVLIIVVINSFLLPSLSSSSIFFIVMVSSLINVKRLALFVTCSRLWLAATPKSRVRPLPAFRLHLAVPRVRLPPYPSPASFRTSLLASSNSRSFSLGWLWSACERDWVLQPNAMMPPGGVYNHVALPWRGCILSMISVPLGFVWALGTIWQFVPVPLINTPHWGT